MIDWIAVGFITLCAILGGEIGRRRQKATGRFHSFMPVWLQRTLGSGAAFGLALFMKAASATLTSPMDFHVWTLVASAATTMIFLFVGLISEVHYAKRRLQTVRGSETA